MRRGFLEGGLAVGLSISGLAEIILVSPFFLWKSKLTHYQEKAPELEAAPGPYGLRVDRGVEELHRNGEGWASRRYQTRQRVSCAMGWPALQLKARWNSGMFETTLFTRSSGIECGLVRTIVRSASGRICSHQEVA